MDAQMMRWIRDMKGLLSQNHNPEKISQSKVRAVSLKGNNGAIEWERKPKT